MNTILKICDILKNFGDQLIVDGQVAPGYADIFTLLTIAALWSVIYTLVERRFDK